MKSPSPHLTMATSVGRIGGVGFRVRWYKECLEPRSNFFVEVAKRRTHKGKNMKKLLTLTGIAGIGTVLALLAACQTTGTTDVVAQKEALLAQSGFKVITVTTPQQQQAVSQLTVGRVTAVKYNGKLYYVFPTGAKDRIYVGKQKQYNAYKAALQPQLTN